MAARQHSTGRCGGVGRVACAWLALLLCVSALVAIPGASRADAALGGLTNFEIDGNTVVNGPGTPGGGGVDWDSNPLPLQDAAKPTEPCTGSDPSVVSKSKLNAFDPFAPNPVPGSVNSKEDLCQGYIGWQAVNVTTAGVTSVHYILYAGWRRNTGVTGDVTMYVPLFGGTTKSAVTLVQFDFDPSAGTSVRLLRWNGSTWAPQSPAPPTSAFQSAVAGDAVFGEFAIDLTAAGVLSATPATCQSVVSTYVFTVPGEGNADLADYLGVPPVEISNCAQVRITKVTNPAAPDTAATFSYNLDRVDGGPVQDATPSAPPNQDANPSTAVLAGALTVPTAPTDNPTNIIAGTGFRLLEVLPPPAPWSHQSIVCNSFNPLVLDANGKATPTTATLTNADGSWSGQTFAVVPKGLLPAGATTSADCTITNRAPSLTLKKNVVNTVGNATATPDMWVLTATPTAGSVVAFGPGTTDGVTNAVAPGTYTLAETPNSDPAPPPGYTAGAWTCVDGAGNPVSVSGGNQVAVAATANISCTISNTAADLARLTLHKVVVGGTASAANFTLTAEQAPNSPGSIDGNPITGVDGAGAITNRPVKRGVFGLTETGPAGYLPSWSCVDGTGATVSTVNQVAVPAEFTNAAELVVTCTVTNTTTALDVDVTGASTNPVGRAHTFTLTARRVDTGAVLPGALLDLTFSDDTAVTANTCATAPGTDANGQCTVTVSSDSPGSFLLTVNGFTNQGPNAPNANQPFTLPVRVSSTKLWTTFRVEGDSAVNLVGQAQHTFTLRGFQNDGSNDTALPTGSVISYTWSGAGPVNPASQCTVDASGACAVTVSASNPAQPEAGTLTVTSVTVTLPDGAGGSTSYTLNAGDVALSAPLPVVTKSWAAFRVRVEPSAQVNLVGQPHTFTVTAEFSTASGVWQPVSGGSVGVSWTSPVAQPDASTTCPALSTSGTCTVTVVQGSPPVPGVGTLSITGLTDPTVTIDGVSTTLPGPLPSQVLDLGAATAQKTWVLVDVAITPGVDNLAGEPHTFTVQVTGFDGDGPFPDGTGVPSAIVTSSVVSTVGGAAVTADACSTAPGTDANGQCTLTVNNAGSGSIAVQLQQVSVTVDGTPFVIDLTPGSPGVRTDAVLPIVALKVWWQYRVILSDSSTNPLGVAHTFVATAQRTRDGGATWLPVPDGTTLNATFTDPFLVAAIDPSSTCPSTGTVGGTCTYVVTSTAPTVGTLRITGIASTWLDRNRDGDRGAATDPTPDPNELASELVTIPATAFGTGSNPTVSKTWWDFAIDVSGPAENPVGTNHTFTLTVRYSDGFGFQPVSPGTTLTYSWSGPAGSAENSAQSTCDPANGPGTNTSGQCTVVINSPSTPGTGTLTITGIASTTIPEPTRTVSFTFPTPATTTKTWIAYQATIGPTATNLSGTPHTFTVNVQQNRGDGAGFVAVPDGTTLALTSSDPSKLVSETCSTGTTGGMCTVDVSSADPGEDTVIPGAITVALLNGSGGTTPVTVQSGSPAYATPAGATKTWVAVAVTVTPASATNVVGDPHTFTVTVDVVGADGTTTPAPAPDGTTVAWTFEGPGTLDAAATSCDDTGTSGGTCDIVFTNDGTPGSGTLMITSATFTVNGTPFTVGLAVAGPGQATPPPITATKTWVGAGVVISPSSSNPAGTDHVFTITVTRTDGVPATGATVDYTWTGTGTATPPDGCTTDAAGTCTVSVSSATAGTGTLSVTGVTDGNLVFDLATPVTASKTWFAYRVLFDTDTSTNKVGEPHTFTAIVQQTSVASPTDADWTAVPDGTTLTVAPSGAGTVDLASTCLTGGTTTGMCQLVVHDAGPGTLVLSVTAIASTTLDGAPFANIALTTPATASKTWVSVAVTVTPPGATNLAGESHTFTVSVDVLGADGTATPQPADGATVAWSFVGPGTLADDACATGTTAGTCTVTFDNDGTTGSGTFAVSSVTFSANGQEFTVGFTAAEPGQATPPPITATKLWQDYRVTVTPPAATNYVDQPHTFTVLAEHDAGDGAGFQLLAGATLELTATGVATDPPIPATCTTDTTGQCVITTTAGTPGTLTLTASYEATSGSGATKTYEGSAEKTWQAGWTLTIVKASTVTGDATPFSFTTTGPAPLDDQSFPLTIGSSQTYEGLLPGTYTITELTDAANLPPPWRFESVECTGLETGATVDVSDATATLTLAAPNPGSVITCTYTNERVNLNVTKTDGGVAAVAGGAPINYTITVTNTGSVATAAPVTVTDTLSAGMVFVGAPTLPAVVTCDPPAGSTLTCTISASIPAGGSLQLVVPVQVTTGTVGPVQNRVTIDSPEDPLCIGGVCPPPPDCALASAQGVTLLAIGGGDPNDNQACVNSAVTTVGGESVAAGGGTGTGESGSEGGLPFTGSSNLPSVVAGACVLAGLSLLGLTRRRRHRVRSA